MKNTIVALAGMAATNALALEMMNVAHRGLWKEAHLPQNTVEAIRAAYDAGAKVVETDFTETESGEMICIHDINELASMSTFVKEPKKITAADRAVINLGEKMGLEKPYRIPLLKDVLAVVPRHGVLQSEIKTYGPTYARQFDDAVKAAGLTEENIIVSSFQYGALRDFHMKYPAYRTLWLGCEVKQGCDLDKLIEKAKSAGFNVFCPGCDQAKKAGLGPSDADRVRAAGLDFRFYGVNSPRSLEYAAAMGVTGFTCNYHLAAYGWARKVPGVRLLPDHGALIPDDFKGCFSDGVKTIGVVMPASIPSLKDYRRCKAWFEYAGYRVKEAPRLNFQQVAPVADRVADFEETWMDPEVDLVIAARGGKGAQDLIDKIDWAKLRTRNDQRLLGFSNITWLLNTMLRERTGHPISGPTFTQFRYLRKPTLDWLRKTLGGETLPQQQLKALRPGAFAGLPCGGHIDILRGMAERKVLPDAKGRVIFLECSARDPKLVRGYLKTLVASGWFEGCAGVVFGDITPGDEKCVALKGAARKNGLAEVNAIKRDFAAQMACPVYDEYDYGHVPLSFAIDFRRKVTVSSDGSMRYGQ